MTPLVGRRIAIVVAFILTACTAELGAPSATPAFAATAAASATRPLSPEPVRVSASPASPEVAAIWRPAVGATWQWQLTGLPLDLSVEAEIYDVDLFETDASTVARLHALGRRVICYVNVGGWEDWRPDAATFPTAVIGKPLDGWPGERWLDIRRLDVLGPILEARFDMCRAKGFDALEPDNIDGYINDTGFPLTAADQLRFNRWLADAAHARGLSIGLKNDLDQIGELLPHFDWALNEQCFAFDECDALAPFIAAGKAVLHVEYELATKDFCSGATALRFSSMLKRWDLDAWRETCG